MKKNILLLGFLFYLTNCTAQNQKVYAGISGYSQNSITLMTGATFDGPPYNVTTRVYGSGGFLGWKFLDKLSLEFQFHNTEMVNSFSIFDNNIISLLPEEGRFVDLRWKSKEIGLQLNYGLFSFNKVQLNSTLGYKYITRGDSKTDSKYASSNTQYIPSTGETLTYIIQGPFIDQLDGSNISTGISVSYDIIKQINIELYSQWVSGFKPILSSTMHQTRDPNPSSKDAIWLQHHATTNNSGFRVGAKLSVQLNYKN